MFFEGDSIMTIGLIGGTGVYDPDLLKNAEKKKVYTPYGATSDLFTVGEFMGKKLVVLPRHGADHTIAPHKVNYRANIYAMKELGVTAIISVSAVGSLKIDLKPGHFVFTDQFIDRTRARKDTYFETGQIAHIGVAEAFCPELRKVLADSAEELSLPHHTSGTCVVINGPRFSSKAESRLYRSWDADTVNMTLYPEVVLAREKEICYANIAMVTDYDVWHDNPVSNQAVLETMKKNLSNVKALLSKVIPAIPDKRSCGCEHALDGAMF